MICFLWVFPQLFFGDCCQFVRFYYDSLGPFRGVYRIFSRFCLVDCRFFGRFMRLFALPWFFLPTWPCYQTNRFYFLVLLFW